MRVKLDKVCKRIYAGGDVPKDRYSTVKTAEYAIPIYANAEKDNGLYGYTDTARENELSITVAARGTIGFTAIRREPFLPVVRLITVVPDLSTVSERYLYYTLRNCKPASSGTSIPQLTVPDIKKNEIELYSLSVQETIADKLDAVGRVIELRQQQLQKLDELVKARFVEMFGEPSNNPMGWKKTTLGAECYYIKDGPHKSLSDVGKEKGYPFISVRNIVNGRIDFSTAKYISENDYFDSIKKCHPQKGDMLYSKGGTTGIAKLVDVDIEFANWVHVAVLKFNDSLNGVFFENMLNSDYCYEQSQLLTKGIANRDLVLSAMAQIKMFKPPLELQQQFAAFVEQVNKSKAAVQKALDEAQLLFDSLMQQYFS